MSAAAFHEKETWIITVIANLHANTHKTRGRNGMKSVGLSGFALSSSARQSNLRGRGNLNRHFRSEIIIKRDMS